MGFRFDRLSPTGIFRLAAEAVLLFLLCWAPWPFASVEYQWESVLISGTALLVFLWIAFGAFNKQLTVRPDAVTYILLAIVAWTALQLIPLPRSIVGTLSPTRLQLYDQLLPAQWEQLPGEAASDHRSDWVPLTLDRFATQVFLAQIVTVTLLYIVVRSWISSRESLRRVAWALTINGILLAILGLAQFFSSSRDTVYWSVQTPGAVFGPFICKNHYPDYVLFCLGLGMGLIISTRPAKSVQIKGVEYKMSPLARLTDSPELFIVGTGLILMITSIPFTLSRGGLLATFVSLAAVAGLVYRVRGSLRGSAGLVALFAALAVGLGGWYGWGIVSERLSTFWSGTAGKQREALWSDVATLIPDFLAVGGGNGTFARFEGITRTKPAPENYVLENAHNEYLEALLEGGLVRLGLTLALCFFALKTGVVAYLRLRDRSSGPLILGILFGLVGLIAHSFVDFGIHMPAVALVATVLLAYAADASTDPTYIPFKKKSLDGPQPDPGRKVLRGTPLVIFSVILAVVSFLLIRDSDRRGDAESLRKLARTAMRMGAANQYQVRVEALTAAAELTPQDGTLWTLLAQAYFDGAEADFRQSSIALAGPVATALPPQAYWQAGSEKVKLGVQAARRARECSPLLPRPHLFLAIYQQAFAKAEKPWSHLERATRCSPTDAEIYLYRGNDAAKENDFARAVQEWRKGMLLNPALVPKFLASARRSLSNDQVLTDLLPPDPQVMYAAVSELYPAWKSDSATAREPFLRKIVALDRNQDWTAAGWSAIARAQSELGQNDQAMESWKKAIAKEPDSYELRTTYANWLEEDERYAEAETQLVWLLEKKSSNVLTGRLEAVRHAMKLQEIINSP